MTGIDVASLSLGAAFLAGLAGSGHCLAMCGGIAGALAMRGNAAGATHARLGTRLGLALAYNVSRVTSYAIAGAIAGLLGRTLLGAVDVAPMSMALRIVAGAVMIAAAGRLLFGWRLLDPLEAAGSGLWRKVLPWASGRRHAQGGMGGAVAIGLAWGWLPCGLTYSMLLLAATTASVARGALVMTAFGVGTLPAMVSATVVFDRAARALSAKATLRTVAGALLLAFGAWTAGNAAYHAVAHASHGAPSAQAQDSGATHRH
ncbi:MAG TPA: sulfite exporter TauE/SafE family protein [Steroidobacteraceae bacterium]|nr:sulfite exporter TauE/SafE family protein [Steroidobacteraceae bacterium]